MIEGLLIALLAVIVGVGSVVIFKKANNPIEQIAEEVIQEETGEKIDLTPPGYAQPAETAAPANQEPKV